MLERLWRKNLKIFRLIVTRVLFDAGCIDDVLQDAYLRMLKSAKRFDDEREAFNYLRQVVVNTALDQYRQRRRVRTFFHPLAPGATATCAANREYYDPLEQLLSREKVAQQQELAGEVEQAVQRLTVEQQQAIRLVFNREKKPLKDVCREAGIPYSTLRSRMLSGIDRVREILRERGIYQDSEEVKNP